MKIEKTGGSEPIPELEWGSYELKLKLGEGG
jgi:hypothetical protein